MKISSKDGSKVMTVIASPGQGPDRSTEVSYTDTKVCFDIIKSRSTLLQGQLNIIRLFLKVQIQLMSSSHKCVVAGLSFK